MLTTTNIDANEIYAGEIRVATFNVSMEATNYANATKDKKSDVSGQTLVNALATGHQQIKNIAEIIQRVKPDIILLNEFDNANNSNVNDHAALLSFIKDYLNQSQNGQKSIDYKYFYQGPVNTGVNSNLDLDNNGEKGQLPSDGYGFGHFPGHYAMALLSKYPINTDKIRTFQHFKWRDMPNALRPIDPTTKKSWYNDLTWNELRLSSKSHWDIPVNVNGTELHILASHPTPPVFDGKEDRNGKRNHDEIRFWTNYITPKNASYIYDDQGNKGGLVGDKSFVILGDLNASNMEGSAIYSGIGDLLNHPNIQDVMPQSNGAQKHSANSKKNKFAQNHTAFWRMRADYVLPSKNGIEVKGSGVFWPTKQEDTFRLIKDRSASSDHRLVWLDLRVESVN
jgi:endonuclease/exonuclease/phosphatase family metal-dependent hydrolase